MKTDADLRAMKGRDKITMLTVYDFPGALMLEGTGLDFALVGDSLAEVVYGFPDTTHADMELMLRHVEAVRRGLKDTHLVGDMPFRSCDTPELALANARRMKSAGADSVKIENPTPETVGLVVGAGIPVCGHVGLTPQTIHEYRKQGKDPASAKRIVEQAHGQERSGCYALVVEAVPDTLAATLTKALTIPTIGIAAGLTCDGQVLVFHDLLGFYARERSYVKKQARVFEEAQAAVKAYVATVKSGGAR